jgi:hypothetical protein
MSNAHYYRYEAELAGAIREANPLTVRGALVGMLRQWNVLNRDGETK